MKKTRLALAALCLLTLNIACNKDEVKQSESQYLVSKLTTETSDGSSFISDYTYNAENLVSKIIWTRIDSVGTEIEENFYTYDSQGRITELLTIRPDSSKSKTEYLWTVSEISIVYYEEGENGAMIEKSNKTTIALDSSGKMIKIKAFTNDNGSWVENNYQDIIWENGNKILAQNYINEANSNKTAEKVSLNSRNKLTHLKQSPGEYRLGTKKEYEYSSKLNPFIGNPYAYRQNFNLDSVAIITFILPMDLGEHIFTMHHSYDYNNNNLPIKRVTTYQNENMDPDTDVTYYEYIEK